MKLFFFAIAIIFFLYSPFLSYGQSTDSLSANDAIRPIELVQEQSNWSTASPDLYTSWLDTGLYGYYGPQPDVLIDGLPVHISFFGSQNLNMLPIYLPKIAKATAGQGPQFTNNIFSPTGTINFTAIKPDSGLAAGASLYWGNETGDPGPWVYDSTRVTPNVDRWGPDISGALSYSNKNWYTKGVAALRNHQQTDPISHRRLHNTMRAFGATRFYPIQTTSKSGLLESGYQSEVWTFRARGIIASDRNYLFLQPFGREVPALAEYQQLVIEGAYKPKSWKFNLRYSLDKKKLYRRNDEHEYVFDWNELKNSYMASTSYISESFRIDGAIGLEQKEISAPGILKQNYYLPKFSLNTNFETGPHSRLEIITHLDFHQKKSAKTFKTTWKIIPQTHWDIQADATFSEVLPINQQSFGYWITQGYNFYEVLGIPVEQSVMVTKNQLTGFTLKNKIDVSRAVSLSLSQQFIHHITYNIPWQKVTYSTTFDSEPGLFSISQESGSRIFLEGSITHAPNKWLNHQLTYYFRKTLTGSQRYKNYWLQIPREQLTYELNISPVQNLSLSIRGTYQTSTEWKEFDALDGEQYRDVDNLFPVLTGTFNSTVPAHYNVDLSAKKWFWDKRLSIQLKVQNLLNDKVRMHPMGADRSFLFNIKATANI